jgi:hypothetical protein
MDAIDGFHLWQWAKRGWMIFIHEWQAQLHELTYKYLISFLDTFRHSRNALKSIMGH